jgi:hypothetical protein
MLLYVEHWLNEAHICLIVLQQPQLIPDNI